MTWDEFKEDIDKQLKCMKLDGTVKVWYIDTHMPDETTIEVTKDTDGKMEMTIV